MTNPLRADELRELVLEVLKAGRGSRKIYDKNVHDVADEILALLTPPPSLADELRERLGRLYREVIEARKSCEGSDDENLWNAKDAAESAYYEATDYMGENSLMEALLTPPPSLASVVAEIDDLIERNNLAMHRDGSVSGLFMGSLAWKLFNNWPQLRTALTISGTGWRPEVRAFADLMEAQLRKNDHKPGWKNDRPHSLLKRLYDEAAELGHAMPYDDDYEAEIVGLEAADVANFAMMIADVCGALPQPKTGDA